MLGTATRQSIADALDAVTGVNGYRFRPKALKAGDAFPVLVQAQREVANAWSATFDIYLILGGDEEAAMTKAESLLPDVVDSLSSVVFADQVRAVTVQTGAGDLFALLVQCRGD